MKTIFEIRTFDHTVQPWGDKVHDLTPVETMDGIRFKREDYFAPLGYGGINGAKLRQCIWLIGAAARAGKTSMVTGASVKSPQLSMGTAVARHYGLPTTIVIGSPNLESAARHPNVAVAMALGARVHQCKIAYNPALQRAVRMLAAQDPKTFILEYGITIDEDDAAVEAFHKLGSEQVQNVPDDIEEIVIPAGSCNSCVSVLYGLARFNPPKLKRVILLGIGPTRLEFIDSRLRRIERVSGLSIRRHFRRTFVHHPKVAVKQNTEALSRGASWELQHYDLHATHYAHYQDERPFRWGDIDFHPTYEGKVMQYLAEHREQHFRSFWESGRSLFWIIGGTPDPAVMMPAIQRLVDRL